jgi:hypothetical protein
LKKAEQPTRGFVQVGQTGISLNKGTTIKLQFMLDVINLAYEQNISNIAIINFGYGQTELEIPTCTKPCPLPAIA